MKSKLSLVAAMVGLAMLATPIAAAAKDHRFDYVRGQGGYVVNKHEFKHGATWVPVHEWHDRGWGDRDEWREHRWGDGDDYRGYGPRGYYPAPAYAAPAPVYGYGPGYGYRDPCRRANSVWYNYQKDRATGHPAAAYDLLRQNQWALHSGCAAGPAPYGYGGGYSGYGQPYGGSSMFSPLLQYFR
jgi:hypothetical protein